MPYLENSDLENWELNFGKGSPGSANPYYLESKIQAQQEVWMRVGVGVGMLLCMLLALTIKWRRKSVQTDEDMAVDITLTGSDLDGDPVTFAIEDNPMDGSLGVITPLTPTSAEVT